MNKEGKDVLRAALIGTVVFVLIAYGLAKVINSFYALPFSVFIGSISASMYARKRAWSVGLLMGLISSILTASYFTLTAHEINLFKVVICPVILNISFGLLGGFAGGIIGKKYNAYKSGILS